MVREVEATHGGVETPLPLPPEWREGAGPYFWVSILGLPFISLVPLVVPARQVVDGSVDHIGVAAAAGGIFLGGAWVMVVWLVRWKKRRRPSLEMAGAGGMLWRESRFHWRLMVVVHWALMLAALLSARLLWIWEGRDFSQEEFLISGLALFGVWGAWGVVTSVLGVARRGVVFLTQDGVSYRHRIRMSRVSWDELDVDGGPHDRAVRPNHKGEHPVIRVRRRLSTLSLSQQFVGDPSRPLNLFVARLDGDPVQLLHALAWYAQHPEYRVELADGRALARVSEGRAVVPGLLGAEG